MYRGRNNFYSSYRGRRSPKEKKLIFLSILLLIFIASGVGFIVLSDHIAFSSEGFYFTFDKKAQGDTPSNGTADDGTTPGLTDDNEEDFDIVIQKPAANENDPLPRILGVSDDIENLLRPGYGNGLVSAASERGCNTLCFDIKGEDGILYIPVTSEYAAPDALYENAEQIKEALLALDRGDMHLAARLTVLCDAVAPRAFISNAIKTSGTTWLDRNMNSWIDPYSQMASDYLCDIIRSSADAGFDAVILDDLCFPTKGKIDMINLSSDAPRYEAIRTILSNVRAAADECGVTLCASYYGEDAVSGQRAADLAEYCHTIFAVTDDVSSLDTLNAAADLHGCFTGSFSSDAFAVPSDDSAALIAGYLD